MALERCNFCQGRGIIACCKTATCVSDIRCDVCYGTGQVEMHREARTVWVHKFHESYPTVMPMVFIGKLPEGEKIKDYILFKEVM